MDVSMFKTERTTVSIHLFTTDEIDEWKQKTGGEVAALSSCVYLTFNIGAVVVKLFSSNQQTAPEDTETAASEKGGSEMNVKVFYDGGLNVHLEKALEGCLSKFGLYRWASGMNLETKERDLAFDDKDRPTEGPGKDD